MKKSHIDQLIRLALREDIGRRDLTTRLLIRPTAGIRALIQAQEEGVVCGLAVAKRVFRFLDSRVRFHAEAADGDTVKPGDVLVRLQGPARPVLSGERTALNFLSRLSGVATLTRRYVREVEGMDVKIMDTRKTTPGWRLLEKYAVRVGGGTNHRMGLWDALLVKENHLRVLASDGRSTSRHQLIRRITTHLRNRASHRLMLEVEVENMEEFHEALKARPRIILLDNMQVADIRQAVRLARAAQKGSRKRVLLEVSGGVNLRTVRNLARAGVDRISVGALTHSAPSLDISLEVTG